MAEVEITPTKLVAGIFILLVVLGTTYYVGLDDQVYYCEDTNLVGICWKLSAVNDLGTQTRCYYNESAPTRYKNCKTGWVEYKETEFIGTPINNSMDAGLIISLDKKSALNKIGIREPRINPCIKKNDEVCIAKIYQKNGINKKIEITYHYCNNWTQPPANMTEDILEEFIPECLDWITLSQEQIETEIHNKANDLLNNIADIQISRNMPKQEISMTREIYLNIKCN